MTEKYPIYSMEFSDLEEAITELVELGYKQKVTVFDVEKIENHPDYDIVMIGKVEKYNPDPEAEPVYNDGYLVDILCKTKTPLTNKQKAKLPLFDPQPNPEYRKHNFAGVEPMAGDA